MSSARDAGKSMKAAQETVRLSYLDSSGRCVGVIDIPMRSYDAVSSMIERLRDSVEAKADMYSYHHADSRFSVDKENLEMLTGATVMLHYVCSMLLNAKERARHARQPESPEQIRPVDGRGCDDSK